MDFARILCKIFTTFNSCIIIFDAIIFKHNTIYKINK